MLSKISLIATTQLILSEAGKCPFGFDSDSTESVHPRVKISTAAYPSEIFTCNGGQSIQTTDSSFNIAKYKQIVKEIHDQYETVADTKSDNVNPRAKFAGCLVRTAGHDFMDYR